MLSQEEAWLLKEKYNGEKSEGFFTDCERLRSGEPLGYVIGFIPFLNCRIYLDSKPLIPRTETEFWVEQAISYIKKGVRGPNSNLKILDLCAGSGCIGVAVAKAISDTKVTFAEIDSKHLGTIEKNCHENSIVPEAILQSDVFEKISGTFDFILSNPPYIDNELDRTQSSVKEFEPHLALYGGNNGLEVIERIVSTAAKYLSYNGELWLEHEPEQVEAIKSLSSHYNFNCATHTDQYGVARFSVLTVTK